MRRQKRKADSVKLNIVQPNPKKKAISVKKASFPFDTIRASSPAPSGSRDRSAITTITPTSSALPDGREESPEVGDYDLEEVATHTLRKRKAVEAWTEVRPSIVSSYTETMGFPATPEPCVFCNTKNACVWCPDCGTAALLCEACAIRLHSTMNVFHNPLLWKDADRMFEPLPRRIRLPSRCVCLSTYERELLCVNEKGFFHCVSVTFCSCESEATTLIGVRLFPATPKHPKLAFTFELLDWFEALLLECQVSAHDFVRAIGVLADSHIIKAKGCNLYPVIIDSFEEYRHMKYTQRQLRALVPERLNDGTKCPACSKDSPVFYSIDGNFGLCRKKSSGKSVRPPLHQNTIFMDQAVVDKYVDSYGRIEAALNKECNQFLAGDALRSNSRYKALDETGVVGVVCRHEFPHMMLSLHHGERLSYIVHTLEKILESCHQSCDKVHLLYDVACTLHRHLEKQGRHDLLGFFELAVPVFHVYGHKVDCQFKYSPRNQPGFGLTDGEVVERLWSYLRRFSRMTKEMRPSHRIDVLTDAILYYAQQSVNKLCDLLTQRIQKALETQQESKRELELLMENSAVTFTTSDIEQWFKEECEPTSTQEQTDDGSNWEMKYFSLLRLYNAARTDLESCSTNSLRIVSERLVRLDRELKAIEDSHQFERWAVDSDVYKDCERMDQERERLRVCGEMETCARERWFLLKLKAKFADGQYLASRLSKNITAEGSKLKKLISKYNSLISRGEREMTWVEANDLSVSRLRLAMSSRIPRNIRLSAIKHYNLVLRADEEVRSLKREMKSTFYFFFNDWDCLSSAIDKIRAQPCSKFNNGALHQLQQARLRCQSLLVKSRVAFTEFVDIPELPASIINCYIHVHVDEREDERIGQASPHSSLRQPNIHEASSDEDEHVARDSPLDEIPDESDEGWDSPPDEIPDESDEGWDSPPDESDNEWDSPRDDVFVEESTDRGDSPSAKELNYENSQPSRSSEPNAELLFRASECPLTNVSSGRAHSRTSLSVHSHPSSDTGPEQSGLSTNTGREIRERQDEHISESEGDDDFIPNKEEVRRRVVRLQRDEFLKQQPPPSLELSEEEQRTLSLITHRTQPGRVSQRGFLHRNPDELKRVVDSAMRLQLRSGPYFIKKKN